MIQDDFLPAIIPPILQQEYINMLERAHSDDAPFMEFIAERGLESQKDMMRMMHIK